MAARRFSVNEQSSAIHMQFRECHEGHKPHAGLDPTKASTGVVWTSERAYEHGYMDDPDSWANLGQGAPEVEDEIEGCFERPHSVEVTMGGREYGPVAGIKPLRAAIANLYNAHHRVGKASLYSWENVCVVPGGRAGLIRIAAVLGHAYLGFFIPDYTAYNEMLSLFRNFGTIPVPLNRDDNYHIHPDKIEEEIKRGTSVFITSNPRNPTGQVITNPELGQIQTICRDKATLIMDEFYGGYNYTSGCDGTVVSAADNIENVDDDDVLIIDGLTKRFRLPGWRVAWIIGPKEFIKAIGSCGSYLDGGTNVPFQEAAIPMLEPNRVKKEMKALQTHFMEKRDYVVDRLRAMGFNIEEKLVPQATFYLWLDLRCLPDAINDGLNFFEACLKEKCIVVPGIFFDLNPSKRRDLFDSPCHHYVRLSYGPRMEILKKGLDAIERVVKKYGKPDEAIESENEDQNSVSKPKKKTPSDLEPTGDDDALNDLFQSEAPKPKLDQLAAIKSIHGQLFDKIIPKSPNWSISTTPLTQPVYSSQSSPAEEAAHDCPKTAPKLGKDDIRRYLTKFQESQMYFPFVRLPQDLTMETMMKRHPFLLLGILAAMSMPDVYVHQRLDAKFKRVLSEKTIERDEKSLDLLQGLLVYLAWYPIHLNPKSLQVLKFLKMAVDLAVDLKFNQHTDMVFGAISHDQDTRRASNERLAYLGCYYLSTSIVLPFGRPQPIPFSPYMQFCVELTPHDDIEARVQALVKAHHLVEQATELNKIASMIFSLDFTRERIYAVHTPMPKFQVHPESPCSRLHLSKCLTIVIRLMTYLTSLPPTVFTTFTFPEWYHIIDVLVTLSRLCFPIPSIPSWDPASTRQIAKYLPLVTGLQAKMEEVVQHLALKSSPLVETAHEKGHVNIPYLFSAVLAILLEQYKERVTSFVDTPFNLFDPPPQYHHAAPQQSNNTSSESQHSDSIYPMKSGLCPVMNGALKGTQYGDAMDAFKTTTGGDAWMGSEIGAEIFDGNVIEDWALWDLQASMWEGA
ncbi:hypothetical protein EG328_007928 [Venturia inaequalis]|uniref:Aminotransferase class I/classII large domain-containing protein n=1 Tax=Venturia inaequalis TaxID=5025 RepID=A0A8H3UFQ3_VENIN|nr:hypothetical protein EG328_007928 [Venturia inaequalis]